MLKKLKRKFILVTMSFVTVILIVVVSIITLSSYQRMQQDIDDTLSHSLSETERKLPVLDFKDKKEDGPASKFASFIVKINEQQEIQSIDAHDVEVDEQALRELLPEIFNNSDHKGSIAKQNLAYEYKETSEGYTIAFIDISAQKASMKNLMLTAGISGIGAFCAFLFMSFLLSKWALKPIEKTWNQQKQFVADASHELKTPITVILADSDILLTHTEDTIKQQQKWVENIQSEAKRMKKLVENLLFLAKYDANHERPPLTDMNISDIAWSCLLPFESIAYEKGIHLHSEIENDLYIKGVDASLKQLILIFLDNACKYTPEKGKIVFNLKKSGDKIIMSIQNSGSVIAPEDLDHIFERFYRCDKARVHQGGYGLGLSIAKSITDAHHASLQVTSTSSSGTTFRITFSADH